jgi:Holliday junction resolvasome RuvABC endonuclease subunit
MKKIKRKTKMKKLKIQALEKKLGKKLKINTTALGFDVAKKHTGIAILITLKSSIYIYKLHTINNEKGDLTESFEYFLGELNNFISNVKFKGHKVFVIEDCFFGQNVTTLKALARFSALVWRELKHIADEIYFILPTPARKKIGFKKDKKSKAKAKRQVRDYINKLFGTDIKDEDKTDAMALALAGLIKE